MEIALLAGKYVLVALIYVFVWMVYRGLIAQARADREEESARQARAEMPRMTGPAPVTTPRRTAPTPAPAVPAAIPAPAPSAPVAPMPPPMPVGSSAESVRSALTEDTAKEEPVREEPHVPALLAKELPSEIAAAEGLAPEEPVPATAAESVMEALGEPEPKPRPESPPAPVVPLAPTPGPEPGTLVVSPSTPRLVVLHSESPDLAPGREFPLLAAATIGRAGHSLVVLTDTFVSSQHALIFLKEGRRVLRDRGSTNGTLVNGHRISGDHILRDGDQIMVGTTMLRYVEPE